MLGEHFTSRQLYSYRYRGEESPDLPPEIRRRLFYMILDGFKYWRRHDSPKDAVEATWAAYAEIAGVTFQQEAGARDLATAVIRMRGLPRLSNLSLHFRWLEEYLLKEPGEFCLDVVDILLSSWWRDETADEVNQLLEEYELPYRVTDYRVERLEPALTRRVRKKVQLTKSKLADFCPQAFQELEEAEKTLQTGKDQNDWSRVGHQCRVALQDFAEAAYQKWYPKADKEPLKLAKTLSKMRAVLSEVKGNVSQSQWDLVEALLDPVNGIIQKTEHRSAKESEPLSEADTERCFVQTAMLLEEALTLFESGT